MPAGGRSHPYRSRLRADSGFFFELQYCNEHGLPHSAFLAWDPADRAKAIAFVMEKALRCVMCGTAEWEWDPRQGGRRGAYEPVEHFCHGCYAKAGAQSAQAPNRNMNGTTIELERSGTRESAQREIATRRMAARDAENAAGAPARAAQSMAELAR